MKGLADSAEPTRSSSYGAFAAPWGRNEANNRWRLQLFREEVRHSGPPAMQMISSHTVLPFGDRVSREIPICTYLAPRTDVPWRQSSPKMTALFDGKAVPAPATLAEMTAF